MILRVTREFQIGPLVLPLICKIDGLNQLAERVQHLNWPVVEFAAIAGYSQRSADLNLMHAEESDGSRRPDFQPFSSECVACLHSEVVTLVSFRRNDFVRGPLCADKGMKALVRERGIERSTPEPQMVRHRAFIRGLRVARRGCLRIEVIGIYKICTLGTVMERRVDDLPLRQNVIDLGERVLALVLGDVVRKGQRPARRLVQEIL